MVFYTVFALIESLQGTWSFHAEDCSRETATISEGKGHEKIGHSAWIPCKSCYLELCMQLSTYLVSQSVMCLELDHHSYVTTILKGYQHYCGHY